MVIAIILVVPVMAHETAMEHLNEGIDALTDVASTQSGSALRNAISESRCIAVVPKLTEAAFIAGGKHGHGLVTCKLSRDQWSAPSFFSINGASVGAQVGVQHKTMVILAMNDDGKQMFLQDELNLLGAATEAAAEASAGDHSSSRTWTDKPILTFEVSKGLFAGATLKDTTIKRDDEVMNALYGKNVRTQDILGGTVPVPESAKSFLEKVQKLNNPN